METLLKKIPVSVIAICIAVLTGLIIYTAIWGGASIDIWGIKINPRSGIIQNDSVTLPLGTVIASYLSPEEMKEKYKDTWVLCDGREVSPSSKFRLFTGVKILPDLRGIFIRGLNEGRDDGKQDPDGQDRVVGSYQSDAIKKLIIHNRSFAGAVDGARAVKVETNKGAKETRPGNVALYYYIKIN